MKRKTTFDRECYSLADHFLSDIPGSTAEDRTEMAESIQHLCEEWCREIELSERERAKP